MSKPYSLRYDEGEVETLDGGTAIVGVLRKFASSPRFVQITGDIRAVVMAQCSLKKNRAGLAGSLLVWSFLIDEFRLMGTEWGVIHVGCGEFVATGGEKNDWDRGVALLLLGGVLKRFKGGLLISPHYAYKGRPEGFVGAAAEYARA